MAQPLHDLQQASLQAPAHLAAGAHLAAVQAADGAPIYVVANRDRSDIVAHSTAKDGTERKLHLVTSIVGRRRARRLPRVVATATFQVGDQTVLRAVVSLALSEGRFGLGIAAPDGSAPLLNLTFQIQPGRRLAVTGTHEAVIDADRIAASPLARWIEDACRPQAAKLAALAPLLKRAAARYQRLVASALAAAHLSSPGDALPHILSARTSAGKTAIKAGGWCIAGLIAAAATAPETGGVSLGAYAAVCGAGAGASILGDVVDGWDSGDSGDGGQHGESPNSSGPDDGGDDGGDYGGDDGDGGFGGADGAGGSSGDGGGPGSGCFVRGTPVSTPRGPIPIDQLAVGDEVLAYDPVACAPTVQRVLKVFEFHEPEIMTLAIGGDRVQCTPNHRFFTGGWTAAKKLVVGEAILRRDGSWQTLGEITRAASPQPVFNLTVAEHHSYYVGASGLLVHNRKDDEPPIEDGEDDPW